MVNPEDVKPGMKVVIRGNVYNGQNGIGQASEYRLKVMTVEYPVAQDGVPVGVRFKEDSSFWWSLNQIDPYYEEDTEELTIDDRLLSSLLSCL